ncbi:hypothetical protein J1N35_019317, partial [Gossypium stocksii]
MEESCDNEVRWLWDSTIGGVLKQLREVGAGLDKWFNMLWKTLQKLNKSYPTDKVLGEIVDVKLALNLEAGKEVYWEQRAKANWLKNGDRNTTYFHNFTSRRRRRNHVTNLRDDRGILYESNLDMLNIANNYFTSLFSLNGFTSDEEVLLEVETCISSSMNENLLRDFSTMDVSDAIKSMSPLKVLREDGLDVAEYCIKVLAGEHDIAKINGTPIVLIPK